MPPERGPYIDPSYWEPPDDRESQPFCDGQHDDQPQEAPR